MNEQYAEREQRVTPLELFFDLVFVFAFTQVTSVLSADPRTVFSVVRDRRVSRAQWVLFRRPIDPRVAGRRA